MITKLGISKMAKNFHLLKNILPTKYFHFHYLPSLYNLSTFYGNPLPGVTQKLDQFEMYLLELKV